LQLADAPKRNGKVVQGASVRIDLPIWDTYEAHTDGDAGETASETAGVPEAGEREEEGVIHGV
jgi:hypothetical protein